MTPGTPPNHSSAPAAEDDFRLIELWNIAVNSRWIVIGVAAAVVALAAVYTWRQAPVYESAATLRIDIQNASPALLSELAPVSGMGQGKIETEMLVLESRQIAESVVDSLALHVRVSDASGHTRDDLLEIVAAGRDVTPATFQLEAAGANRYTIELIESDSITAVPSEVRVGQPVNLAGVTLVVKPTASEGEFKLHVNSYRKTVAGLREELRITREDPQAHLVQVGYRDTDAHLSAAVPNAVTETFINYKTVGSKVEARSTVEFLQTQVSSYEGQLTDLENRLKEFREEQQVVSLDDQATEQVQRLATLQAQRDELAAERASLLSLLQRVEREAAAEEGGPSPFRQLASFPTFLANRAVQDLLQTITGLENERSALLVRRTTQSIDIQGLDRRIDQMEEQLYRLAQGYLSSLDNQIASANAALGRFESVLATIPAREIGFARLARQHDLLAEVYKLLQTRLKEAEIQQAVEPGDVRLIDSALTPMEPVYPRPFLNMLLASVLGVGLGFGAAVAREAMDTKVRTREDVENATSGMMILGSIPRIRITASANGNGHRNGKRLRPAAASGERLVTRVDPRNPASEAYRSLRTSIIFSGIDQAPRVLVVTSAMPGDGKSTSAANLAITVAQQGTRTLLVDADLRKGVLHEVLGTRKEPGLTHVLFGKCTLAEAVQQVTSEPLAEQPLNILSAGVFPPNPAELLGSERMRELVASFREQYEMVIFDAPPLNLVTDAALIGKFADATVLVARTGVTDKRALAFAATQLRHLRTAVGGVVLNDIDVTRSGHGHAYGYYGEE